MDIEKMIVNLGENKEAVLKRSFQCKSAEQLLVLAKEYGLDLDKAGAEEIMASMQMKPGELSNDELDAVAGAKPGLGSMPCNVCGTMKRMADYCPKCHPEKCK